MVASTQALRSGEGHVEINNVATREIWGGGCVRCLDMVCVQVLKLSIIFFKYVKFIVC